MSREPVISKDGAAWLRLRHHIMVRIEKLRDDLERPGHSESTASLRGEITALRWIIKEVEPDLPDTPPQPTLGPSNGY